MSTQSMVWKSAGVVVAIGALAAIVAVGRAQTQERADGKYVTQPSEWVAFTSFEDFPGVTGQKVVYRSSNGSTRMVLPLPIGGEEITIENTATRKYFRGARDRWTASPLRARPYGGKPVTMLSKAHATEVSRSDPRIASLAQAHPQLTFWQMTNGSNQTTVFCPELNLLPVYSEMGPGMVMRVVSVVLGEPNADLFEPPTGVEVVETSTPAGSGLVHELPSAAAKRPPQ